MCQFMIRSTKLDARVGFVVVASQRVAKEEMGREIKWYHVWASSVLESWSSFVSLAYYPLVTVFVCVWRKLL